MCPQSDGYGALTASGDFPASDLAWCRQLIGTLKLGGVWGVPRSGLTFTHVPTGLELSAAMPFTAAMETAAARGADIPESAKALREYQRSDFECIRSRFQAAGYMVTDPRNLLKEVRHVGNV